MPVIKGLRSRFGVHRETSFPFLLRQTPLGTFQRCREPGTRT